MQRKMKRFGRLWGRICTRENIEKAVALTIAGRNHRRDIKWLQANREEVVRQLMASLRDRTFEFAPMTSLPVSYPKPRTIRYPSRIEDRVVHHAMMNVLAPAFLSKMTADSYGSIPGRGFSSIIAKIVPALREHPDWYFVKTDIRKFYESIDHGVLKEQLRRVVKCQQTLQMLDRLIDAGGDGLAIGVYPSQYLANFYLSGIDHWAKEQARVRYYFRYMDDIVALLPDKASAKDYLVQLEQRVNALKLELKSSARIAPVSVGIDFVGYVFFPNRIRLRKTIKKRMQRRIRTLIRRKVSDATFKRKTASYLGWCKWANARNLIRKSFGEKYILFKKNMEYKKLSDLQAESNWFGLPRDARVSIRDLVGKDIIFFEYQTVTIHGEEKVAVKFAYPEDDTRAHFFLTRSVVMKDRLAKTEDLMPFVAKVKNDKNYYYFE